MKTKLLPLFLLLFTLSFAKAQTEFLVTVDPATGHHTIIDSLVKPTFDGVLPLTDLASAIAEARAAIMPDPRQVALKREIAEIRARVLSEAPA